MYMYKDALFTQDLLRFLCTNFFVRVRVGYGDRNQQVFVLVNNTT